MTAEALTTILTALCTAWLALRGQLAWGRFRTRYDGIPRCVVCGHRCESCRAALRQLAMQPDSDPPS